MWRAFWRICALLVVAIALWLSIRDLVGFGDAQPAANLPYLGYNHLWGFVRVLSLAVAASLILKCADRPPAQMLAGALIGLALNNNWWFYSLDNPLIRVSAILNYVGIGFGLSQFIRFAASYGSADFRSLRRLIACAAPYVGAAATVFGLLWWLSVMDMQPYVVYNRLFWAAWDSANVLTILAAFTGLYLTPEGGERARMAWVAFSFSLAAFGTALHGFDRAIQHHDTVWVNYVDTLLQLSLPLGLGYALLRHRLLDKDFVLHSALLYSLITVILSAGEVGLERLSRLLVPEQGRITANAAEFGLSLIVVVSYKRFEHWADSWTERIVGRTRGEARTRLDRFCAEAIPNCGDAFQLEDRLVRELEALPTMQGVALYRRRGESSFERIACTIPGLPKTRERMPAGAPDAIPFPMGAYRPSGFIVCRFSQSPDADDLKAIAECAAACGTALDALESARLERRVRELESMLYSTRGRNR